jgi:hypothetical protein
MRVVSATTAVKTGTLETSQGARGPDRDVLVIDDWGLSASREPERTLNERGTDGTLA